MLPIYFYCIIDFSINLFYLYIKRLIFYLT